MNNNSISEMEISRLINENIDAISTEYHLSQEEHDRIFDIAHKRTEKRLKEDGYTITTDDNTKKHNTLIRELLPDISWIAVFVLLTVNFRAMSLRPLATISLTMGILWTFRLIKRIVLTNKK